MARFKMGVKKVGSIGMMVTLGWLMGVATPALATSIGTNVSVTDRKSVV